MVRVTLPFQGVAVVLLAASAALGQTPQLVVEPPRAIPRLTPQPQTTEPPAAKLSMPTTSESCPIVIEEAPSEYYPPVFMPPPPPAPTSGHKYRRKQANAQQPAPGFAGPYSPWPSAYEEFGNGFGPSPYAPPPPAAAPKHRWRHTPPDNTAAQPGPYGYGEFAEGYAYTPVGPPPPPNGTGKKNRWKRGNPDLSSYPIPGADMMDDGLNAFTDPNCLKSKHGHLHGLFHKSHAAKPAAPPPQAPPQPCLYDETGFPIE